MEFGGGKRKVSKVLGDTGGEQTRRNEAGKIISRGVAKQ